MTSPISIVAQLGNADLLTLPKTAFLCSRRYPAGVVLRAYDWAIAQRNAGHCVVSGFHSQIEKDVLHYLLKGNQPIIVALARGLKQRIEPNFQAALSDGRLLIISPFPALVTRVTEETAAQRNRLMINLADVVMVAHASAGGRLDALLQEYSTRQVVQFPPNELA